MEELLEGAGATGPLAPVDPPYARKLLRDAAAYARSLGLPPHPDYASVELMFGDVAADACDVEFQFGLRRPAALRSRTDQILHTDPAAKSTRLRRHLGDDGFDFGIAEAAFDTSDDLEDGGTGYDPDVGPDPVHWLSLEEAERLRQTKDYHRRHDPSLAEPEIHAAVHVVIENQIATGYEAPTQGALERLMAEGLTRHEAVHALGSVPDRNDRRSRQRQGGGGFPGGRLQRRHRADYR